MPPRYQSTVLSFEEKARNLFDHFGQPAHRGHARTGGGSPAGGLGQQSLIQNPAAEAESSGAAQLLAMSATDASIAPGGAVVPFDSILAQHGFDGVAAPSGGAWVHPVSGIYFLAYEHGWETYEGGGLIELELDGEVGADGVIGSGSAGQDGRGSLAYYAAAGQVGRIKVTHSDESAQSCSAVVRTAITDPTDSTPEATAEWTQVFSGDVWGLARDGSSWWTTEGISGVTVSLRSSDWTETDSFEADDVAAGVDLERRVRGIAVVGSDLWVSGSDVTLGRYNSSGVLQSSFGMDGEAHHGVAFDGTDLWIVDRQQNRIRRYSTAGAKQQTITLPGGGNDYHGLHWWGGRLWLMNGGANRIDILDTSGTVLDSVDTSGAVDHPTGVWIADDGTLYISKDGEGVWRRAARVEAP